VIVLQLDMPERPRIARRAVIRFTGRMPQEHVTDLYIVVTTQKIVLIGTEIHIRVPSPLLAKEWHARTLRITAAAKQRCLIKRWRLVNVGPSRKLIAEVIQGNIQCRPAVDDPGPFDFTHLAPAELCVRRIEVITKCIAPLTAAPWLKLPSKLRAERE